MSFLLPLALVLSLPYAAGQTPAGPFAQAAQSEKFCARDAMPPENFCALDAMSPGGFCAGEFMPSEDFCAMPPPPPKTSETYFVQASQPEHPYVLSKPAVPLLGVRIDVGFPDGVGVDFLGNPLSFLQLHLGVMSNVFGIGLRGGISFIPWRGVFRPALTVEAAHTWLTSWLIPKELDSLILNFISSVRYTSLNSSLGFDVGSAKVAFFFRLGASFLFAASGPLATSQDLGDGEISLKKLKARIFVPNLRLGISICFL